jgi:MoaA/NifB/PqqE/SkfB family radical SAM enzyme
MNSMRQTLRGRYVAANRRLRELRKIGHALLSSRHAVMAHIIPIRRCNLACTYCNEFDDFSPPVPAGTMMQRIDHLRRLGTAIITFSGGEPLLHPDLDAIIRHTRDSGALACLITNGYLLTADRIQRLNRAGLDHMQISIDNVMPDDVSKKSLKVLDKKLQLLAEHAEFHVNINSVLGSGVNNPEDSLVVSQRAQDLGFSSTVGIIHDGQGQLKPLGEVERRVYDKFRLLEKRSYSQFNRFQEKIVNGEQQDWKCRAGGRYLYICEDGLVHYCSQQRGFPGIPIENYTRQDLHREYLTEKACAPHCTISCVHQTSLIDYWRDPQIFKNTAVGQPQDSLVQIEIR